MWETKLSQPRQDVNEVPQHLSGVGEVPLEGFQCLSGEHHDLLWGMCWTGGHLEVTAVSPKGAGRGGAHL